MTGTTISAGRARRVERMRDLRTGEEECNDETHGIEDGQEDAFDFDFQRAMAASNAPRQPQVLQHQSRAAVPRGYLQHGVQQGRVRNLPALPYAPQGAHGTPNERRMQRQYDGARR